MFISARFRGLSMKVPRYREFVDQNIFVINSYSVVKEHFAVAFKRHTDRRVKVPSYVPQAHRLAAGSGVRLAPPRYSQSAPRTPSLGLYHLKAS
jgi:hypothetical protein